MEPTHALWVDLETTGTDETRGEVLEVGAILTTLDAVATEVSRYQLTIKPANRAWFSAMSNVVVKMHSESGLLDDIAGVEEEMPREAVDRMLVAWRRAAVREARAAGHVVTTPLVLAGSGVGHFDGRWLRLHFPEFSRALTYYTLDVGVLRRAFAAMATPVQRGTYWWTGAEMPRYEFPERKAHRGLDDVVDHVAEWRWYASHMRNPCAWAGCV